MDVKQEHAAILRSAMARVITKIPPAMAQHLDKALKEYALKIAPYCKHPDLSMVQHENKNACLDCGKRFDVVQ